jgi:hypothetical protein
MLGSMYGSTSQKVNEAEILTDASCEKRHQEYLTQRKKNPTLIPVLVHPIDMQIEKKKYLVNPDVLFAKFAEVSRNYCRGISDKQLLFFSANDTIINKKMTMTQVYELHKRQDEFLHVSVRPEPSISSIERPTETPAKLESPEPEAKPEVAQSDVSAQNAVVAESTLP